MSEYVPETEDFRSAYAGGWDPESVPGKNAYAEFDRWLKSIQAEACDEGIAIAGRYGHEDGWDEDINPYRHNPYTPERWETEE